MNTTRRTRQTLAAALGLLAAVLLVAGFYLKLGAVAALITSALLLGVVAMILFGSTVEGDER